MKGFILENYLKSIFLFKVVSWPTVLGKLMHVILYCVDVWSALLIREIMGYGGGGVGLGRGSPKTSVAFQVYVFFIYRINHKLVRCPWITSCIEFRPYRVTTPYTLFLYKYIPLLNEIRHLCRKECIIIEGYGTKRRYSPLTYNCNPHIHRHGGTGLRPAGRHGHDGALLVPRVHARGPVVAFSAAFPPRWHLQEQQRGPLHWWQPRGY